MNVNRTWIGRRAGGLWIAALLMVAGCGSPQPASSSAGASGRSAKGGTSLKLLVITNSNADWWNAVEKGMSDAGKEFGVDAEMKRNDRETTGQIRLLEDAVSRTDVQGVAVSVYEAEAPGILDAMRELQNAGKVVITYDSDTTPKAADARRAYIGTNNIKAGEAAGRAAAAIRPDGGKVCVFVGTSSAANAVERKNGFFQGAGPKFTQLEIFDDGGDFARASSNVQTAITKYPDLGVLLGLWSYNATRIAQQVKASPEVRQRTTVVTFDLDELAVNDLVAGDIDVTVCQNPYEMGYQGVKLFKALIEKDDKTVKEVLPDGASRDTGVRVVVPRADSPVFKNKDQGDTVLTIDEMKTWLASKGLNSS